MRDKGISITNKVPGPECFRLLTGQPPVICILADMREYLHLKYNIHVIFPSKDSAIRNGQTFAHAFTFC